MGTSSRTKIAAIAAISTIISPTVALPQTVVGAPGGGSYQPTIGTAGVLNAQGQPVVAAPVAVAPTGGLQVDIGLSSSLKVDDNFQLQPNSTGTTTIFDNTLTFGLTSDTSVRSFSLTASTVLRYASIPGRTTSGFEDPTLRLAYSVDGVNSRFSVSGRYRHADREFLDPFQVEAEQQSSSGLIGGGGTVTWKNLGVNYQTGINDPLGFSIGLLHDEKDYDATAEAVNPRLFDNESNSVNGTVTLKASGVTQFRFSGGYTKYEANDTVQTSRKTTDISVGVVQDINKVLVLDAQIGRTKVKTDTTGGSSQRTGATGSVTLTQTLPNGTAYGTLGRIVNQNGSRTTLSFGRSLQLPLGSLTATLGGTKTPSGRTNVIASLGYNVQLKTSDISVSLNRSVSTNSSSEDVLDTRLTVAYGYEIDNNSRLNFAVNWGRSESALAGGTAPTITRTSLRAAYSRDLTQDWSMTGGVLLRGRDDSTVAGKADSNSIFLSLDRNFSFRP